MTFGIRTLGTVSATPLLGKHTSAHVLNAHEQFYLIDAGEGVQSQLVRYGISPMKINHIFITHCHGDHVYGLFGLLSTMSLMGRKMHLDIYAPEPIEQIMEFHRTFFDKKLSYPITVHVLKNDTSHMIYENRVMTVTTVPLKHKVPTVGFIFREKEPALNVDKEAITKHSLTIAEIATAKRGEDIYRQDQVISFNEITYRPYCARSIAFISDTSLSKWVIDAVKGVDLLYHEATFLKEDRGLAVSTGHSTTHDAATVAREAGVGRLVLGHFSPRYKGGEKQFEDQAKELFANCIASVEGEFYSVKAQRK